MRKRRIWTEEECQILKELYPNTSNKEISAKLNRSIRAIYDRASKLGIKKDKDFLKTQNRELSQKLLESGKAHRFKKGNIPPNKGKKMEDFMSPETIKKFKANQFKKGNKPHNTKEDGEVTIRRMGTRQQYKYIKIKDNHWELLHRLVWESANGQIPLGHNITFKDGNSLNCNLSNLQIKTNEELMLDNSIHQYPEEVVSLIHLNAKLKRVINKHLKQ